MDLTATLQQELKLRGFQFNREQTAEIQRAFSDTIIDFLRNGEPLVIPKIGRFVIKKREARTFISNLTNREESVSERYRVGFEANRNLNLAINKVLHEKG